MAGDVLKCCSFETTIKGVLFYNGHTFLNPATFQRVYLVRDHLNQYHHKSYWVKLIESNATLDHLSREAADAWYYVARISTIVYSVSLSYMHGIL